MFSSNFPSLVFSTEEPSVDIFMLRKGNRGCLESVESQKSIGKCLQYPKRLLWEPADTPVMRFSTGTAPLRTRTVPCMKLAGTSVSGMGLTFACLSARWANKGSKVLRNELCERPKKKKKKERREKKQTRTAVHLQLSEQRKCLWHTCLRCHRGADTVEL